RTSGTRGAGGSSPLPCFRANRPPCHFQIRRRDTSYGARCCSGIPVIVAGDAIRTSGENEAEEQTRRTRRGPRRRRREAFSRAVSSRQKRELQPLRYSKPTAQSAPPGSVNT